LPWQPMQPPMLTPATLGGFDAGVNTLGGGEPTTVGAPELAMRPWNCCSV
jgi:hypothetical protein